MKNIDNIKNLYLQLPKKHKLIISASSLVLLLLVLIPSEPASASKHKADVEVGKRYQLALPGQAPISGQQAVEVVKTAQADKTVTAKKQSTPVATEPVAAELITAEQALHKPLSNLESTSAAETPPSAEKLAANINWQQTKVRSGDSLAKIFKRLGFSAKTTHAVTVASGPAGKILKKINVGDVIKYHKDQDQQLAGLDYPLSDIKTLHVRLTDNGYQSEISEKAVEIREAVAQGTINSNFWSAASTAGLKDNQIINLANIFGWDIDFALDIRTDDSFHVVYEQRYVDGEYIGTGEILAAEFINQGETFQAIRFTDGDYYTPSGKSMRKAFLRAPVNFRYISSNFKKRRFHPIQKRWKAHNGVDYRASTGTPVVAAGNGKVTHSTYNKYNGNYVFIQHGDGIVTKYLHFSKRAVKKGQRVKQGQVIGYVGSTGMSQAPHLHYEFLVNGVHRNPRTVKLPDAKPINKKYKAEFNQLADARLKQLAGSRKALLAMQPTATDGQGR